MIGNCETCPYLEILCSFHKFWEAVIRFIVDHSAAEQKQKGKKMCVFDCQKVPSHVPASLSALGFSYCTVRVIIFTSLNLQQKYNTATSDV